MMSRQTQVEITAAWIQAGVGAVAALLVFLLGVLATLALQHFANRRADRDRTQQLAAEFMSAIARLEAGVIVHKTRIRQPIRYLVPAALAVELFGAWLCRNPRGLTTAVKASVDQSDAEANAALAAVEPLYMQLTACAMAFSMHSDRALRGAAFAVNDAANAMVQAHLAKTGSPAEADAVLTAATARFRAELERSTRIRPHKSTTDGRPVGG